MILILSFVISIYLVMFVWRREAFSKYMVTPLFMVFLYMLLRVFPGFAHSYITDVFDNNIIFLAFIVALIGLLAGYFTGGLISGKRVRFYSKFHDLESPVLIGSQKSFFFALNIFSILLIVSGLYLYDGLPYYLNNVKGLFISSVQDFGSDFREYRKVITKGHYFGGEYKGQGALRILQNIGWSIVICGYYGLYRFVNKRKYLVFLCFSVLLAFFFVTGDGTRGPFLLTVLCLIVMISLSRVVSKVFVVRTSLVLFSLLFAISLFNDKIKEGSSEGGVLYAGFLNLIERVSLGNSINDVYTLKLVDKGSIDLKYGGNFVKELVNSIPGYSLGKPFANELYVKMTGDIGGTTYMTGTNIMRGYIDFGVLGVGLSFLLAGVLIYFFSRLFAARKKSLYHFSFYPVWVINISQVYSVGVVGIMVNSFVLIFLMIFVHIIMKVRSEVLKTVR